MMTEEVKVLRAERDYWKEVANKLQSELDARQPKPVQITAEMVASLRKQTGEGIMCCNKALQFCNGDINEAAIWLREMGNI